MRILLINPFYPIGETPSPPLGLAYLAAVLEAAGWETRVADYVVTPYSRADLQRHLEDFSPAIVGVTAVTMTVDHALAVVRGVKAITPSTVTVMGGPHITFTAAETLAAVPQLDAVVRGEGEAALVALAQAVDQGVPWNEVPGLVYRRDGRVVANEGRAAPVDIDRLPPPARGRLALGRYRALNLSVSMTTSRGCPHGCIFCVGRKMVGAKVRYRSADKVAAEMAALAGLGFPQINLADDLFTADTAHCLAVCREIQRRELTVNWTSFARVDTVSPRLLEAMRSAGCTAVSFGVESGNADMLRRIRKGISLDQVVAAVKMCTDAGILPHASFILGLPGETPDSLDDTLAFGHRLEELGVSYGFHVLAPFPGTAVRDRIERYDLKLLTSDWSQYHANRAVAETAGVGKRRIDAIVESWEERFDAWLGDLKRKREAGGADPEEIRPLENLERTVLIYDLMMASAIEKCGHWHPEGRPSTREALAQLARQTAKLVSQPAQEIEPVLSLSLEKGDLACSLTEDAVSFSWVDQLPIP